MLRPAQMLGDIWTSCRGLEPRKREQAPALHRNVPPKFGVRRLAAALRFQEIKGTLFMPHSDLKPPYGLLIGGVFFLFLAVGRAPEKRGHTWVKWSTATKNRRSFGG
jgi:hypothetical protein